MKNIYLRTDVETNRYVVTKPIIYKDVTVPPDYMTDGLTKKLNKYTPNCMRAACVHDYVCSTKCIPRKTGDLYFYEILTEDKVYLLKRTIMYMVARFFAIITLKK